MTIAMSDLQLVGGISVKTEAALRETLLHCHRNFGTYRRAFSAAEIVLEDIVAGDPLTVLRRLDLLGPDGYHSLAEESLIATDQIIDMETSSGTTGRPKKRYISYDDSASELEFLAELFAVCGIGHSDRVACLDTDPLMLMASFTGALDRVGVEESYAYCVGPDFDRSLAALSKLGPTVIITVPSMIERCYGPLTKYFAGTRRPDLSKIVYVGEPLSPRTRALLESNLGVEVFGYYGASETSALGIECRAHDGTHLFTERNIVEMAPDQRGGPAGEIVVTTLHQRAMPLLRYTLCDLIELKPGPCSCGLDYPRVQVQGRADASLSILGATVDYNVVLDTVRNGGAPPDFMQLALTRDVRDKLTIVLPEPARSRESRIRDALLASQPDLEFLVAGNYLDLEFSFVDGGDVEGSRKTRRVVDLREPNVG